MTTSQPERDGLLYESPFSNRYGSPEMRSIWSQQHTRRTWRRIWVALARAENQAGLVSDGELSDLKSKMGDIDVGAALEIEEKIGHDLMAEQRVFASQAPVGGRILHLGATSEDIKANADILLMRESVDLLRGKAKDLLSAFIPKINDNADKVCLGYTHLQPAEPITIGYRLATYAADLLEATEGLDILKNRTLKGKGMKGAVGTSASYEELLTGTGMSAKDLEKMVMRELGLDFFEIATQVYPRRVDFEVVSALNSLIFAPTRFANDLTFLSNPQIGEMYQETGQRGRSSAMPHKLNPEDAENIVALAKFVESQLAPFAQTAMEPALERRLTDSAIRRVSLPQVFLAVDEILERVKRVVNNLVVDENAIERNLQTYGPFLGTERLVLALVKKGKSRLEMHELVRTLSLEPWRERDAQRLIESILADPEICGVLSEDEIRSLLNPVNYIGNAPDRARNLAKKIKDYISG